MSTSRLGRTSRTTRRTDPGRTTQSRATFAHAELTLRFRRSIDCCQCVPSAIRLRSFRATRDDRRSTVSRRPTLTRGRRIAHVSTRSCVFAAISAQASVSLISVRGPGRRRGGSSTPAQTSSRLSRAQRLPINCALGSRRLRPWMSLSGRSRMSISRPRVSTSLLPRHRSLGWISTERLRRSPASSDQGLGSPCGGTSLARP